MVRDVGLVVRKPSCIQLVSAGLTSHYKHWRCLYILQCYWESLAHFEGLKDPERLKDWNLEASRKNVSLELVNGSRHVNQINFLLICW